jgi:hypothetical protein
MNQLIEKINIHFFPYEGAHGLYNFVFIVKDVQYKFFDFIEIDVQNCIDATTP